MNYKITKKKSDARSHTCGLWIPDGFTVVVELTHERINQLEKLKKFGYNVEKTDSDVGAWDQDGREVQYESIARYYTEQGQIQYIASDRVEVSEEETEEPEDKNLDNEIRMLRSDLDDLGVKYRKDAGVNALRKKVNEARGV